MMRKSIGLFAVAAALASVAAADGSTRSPNAVGAGAEGVQLWENGPYWAECNVGAVRPEESGFFFWWGDTVGYRRNADNNGWISSKDGSAYRFNGCPTHGKDNPTLRAQGYVDSTGNLAAAHDAATAHLGAPWRMPTASEIEGLVNRCDTKWTTQNGVAGRLVTGRGAFASKSIFLPAAGDGDGIRLYYAGTCGNYWSSTPRSDRSDLAWSIFYSAGSIYRNDFYERDLGRTIRPLRGSAR